MRIILLILILYIFYYIIRRFVFSEFMSNTQSVGCPNTRNARCPTTCLGSYRHAMYEGCPVSKDGKCSPIKSDRCPMGHSRCPNCYGPITFMYKYGDPFYQYQYDQRRKYGAYDPKISWMSAD